MKTTKLDLASTQVNRLPYFLSFVQTRIKATSQGKLEIVDKYPSSQPFEETELVKTSHASSRTVNGELALGMNLAIKASTYATRSSGVDRTTSEWQVTPHEDEDVAGGLRSASAIWKYAHSNLMDPVKDYPFDSKLRPHAKFGFQTIKTEVEFEVMSFWSSNRKSQESRGKRKDPTWWPWVKGSKKDSSPIFFNFLYQIAVVVDLEKIPDGDSWIMPEMKIDNVKREDLDPSKSPIPLGRTTEIAQQYSESGQMDDMVSTDCNFVVRTAVEGRVKLTSEERTGVNTQYFATRRNAEVRCYIRSPVGIVADTSECPTVTKHIVLGLCRTFCPSDPFTFPRTTAGPRLRVAIPWDRMAIRPADGNTLRSYMS